MHRQELSKNRRLATLAKLPRELEQSSSPGQTLRIVRRSFADSEGPVTSVWVSTRGLPPGGYRIVAIDTGAEPERDLFDGHESDSAAQSGGILGHIFARIEPQLLQHVDWSTDASLSTSLSGFASVIALPLTTTHLPVNWVLLARTEPDRFTESDLESAVERAALVSVLLHNQVLTAELARAHAQIDGEARQLGELQRALLPAALPPIAGLETAASYEPSGRAGGDVYDFFPLTDDGQTDPAAPVPWCVFIGDTAGHGLAASVVMAIVQAALRLRSTGAKSPAALLVQANRHLCSRQLQGFVTAFLGVFEPATRRLTYANAGHPPPLHRPSNASPIAMLDAVASYPIGIDPAETFQEATVQLAPGDTLLLYTDGITEAAGDSIADQFGADRLKGALSEGPTCPQDVIHRIREQVRRHQRGNSPADDQTLVAVRVL